MNKIFLGLVLLFLGIGGVLVIQAMKTSTSSVHMPSELATFSRDTVLPRVRVAGEVVADKIVYELEPKIRLEFSLKNPSAAQAEQDVTPQSNGSIPVKYDKLMPDMFAPGRSVIVDGEFKDGTLYARELLTQCPSKYKPPKPIEGTVHPNGSAS
ncbi:MAG: cytochrome c maturation protein CcmE [Bdellovibrionales bacterium]|nr:cytochrome c maturation protein CcmE [Bdellovibrionales bacterium]